jgi:hypothetical protein
MTISADRLNALEQTAKNAKGTSEWSVVNDHKITDIVYSDRPRALRPVVNLRRAFVEVTGVGLSSSSRILRDAMGGSRWAMARTWLTFRDTNAPDAAVGSAEEGGVRIIAYWDEDARHVAAFDPATALALIEEVRRLQSESDEAHQEVIRQVAKYMGLTIENSRLRTENDDLIAAALAQQGRDGAAYGDGYFDGSALVDQYKAKAECLRGLLTEIEGVLSNAEAFGDEVNSADITKIIDKIDLEAPHGSAAV